MNGYHLINTMNKAFYDLVRKAPSNRWNGIKRVYGPEVVGRLRSGVEIEYTLAVSLFKKMNLETKKKKHSF